jgi:hypothetical protein
LRKTEENILIAVYNKTFAKKLSDIGVKFMQELIRKIDNVIGKNERQGSQSPLNLLIVVFLSRFINQSTSEFLTFEAGWELKVDAWA